MTTATTAIDTDAANELDLYAENEYALYGDFKRIIATLSKRIAAGTYDPALAPKLWRYWYDEAARRYVKEIGSTEYRFPPAVRAYCAAERARDEYEKIVNGEYL